VVTLGCSLECAQALLRLSPSPARSLLPPRPGRLGRRRVLTVPRGHGGIRAAPHPGLHPLRCDADELQRSPGIGQLQHLPHQRDRVRQPHRLRVPILPGRRGRRARWPRRFVRTVPPRHRRARPRRGAAVPPLQHNCRGVQQRHGRHPVPDVPRRIRRHFKRHRLLCAPPPPRPRSPPLASLRALVCFGHSYARLLRGGFTCSSPLHRLQPHHCPSHPKPQTHRSRPLARAQSC
jgi:hypothetical protein